MGCANILCPCCNTTEAVACGQCASKFSWFGPLLAFIGQAWIMFGVASFFSQLNSIRQTHQHDISHVFNLAASFVVCSACARLPVEAMARKSSRMTYFMGAISFVLAFITLPFYSESPYVAYTVSAPLLGLALTATDTSFRVIMPDQWGDRRAFYLSTSKVFKAVGAVLGATVSYYITTVVSWKIFYYSFAAISFVPQLYITYFVPSRLTPVEHTSFACLHKEQTRIMVAMIVGELSTGGIRWVLPIFVYVQFILSKQFSDRDTTMLLGTYFSLNFISHAVRDVIHIKSIQLGRYSYIVSAVTTGFFSVCLTFTQSAHLMWVIVALTAVTGFALGGIDEVVTDVFEDEHVLRVSTMLTLVSGLAAVLWFTLLSSGTSDGDTDVYIPLRVISGVCVIPALCMCYASLPLARQKTYLPLSVGTSPA